jgi:hypothetical protein
MIKIVLTATLVLLATFTFSVTAYADNENIVAMLDDENITVETLTAYVKNVAGSNYKSWLRDKEGLQKLVDLFINRTLLLEYAKQTVDKKNTIITNHNARSMDADVMYLSSLLQKEIQDKVIVTEKDVLDYMVQKQISSEKQAKQEIESLQKNELMVVLVGKVRNGHEISYLN